jgi:hypothetical protein
VAAYLLAKKLVEKPPIALAIISVRALLDGKLSREAVRERNRDAVLEELARRPVTSRTAPRPTDCAGPYGENPIISI